MMLDIDMFSSFVDVACVIISQIMRSRVVSFDNKKILLFSEDKGFKHPLQLDTLLCSNSYSDVFYFRYRHYHNDLFARNVANNGSVNHKTEPSNRLTIIKAYIVSICISYKSFIVIIVI